MEFESFAVQCGGLDSDFGLGKLVIMMATTAPWVSKDVRVDQFLLKLNPLEVSFKSWPLRLVAAVCGEQAILGPTQSRTKS